MGSYNYLGYAQNNGPINESVETTIEQLGVGIASTPNEIGLYYM
jgi:7-keto-8-aminopelargonate synthetase-like enzyme